MIVDILANRHHYTILNKGFTPAFDFLVRPDLRDLPAGKYEIDGERIFAMISRDQGRRKEDALLEAHEKFIDIQLVLSGVDEMGWKSRLLCLQPATRYDREKDIQFFRDKPDMWLTVSSGMFAIFFPHDGHLPSISEGDLHKVVVKIAVTPAK